LKQTDASWNLARRAPLLKGEPPGNHSNSGIWPQNNALSVSFFVIYQEACAESPGRGNPQRRLVKLILLKAV